MFKKLFLAEPEQYLSLVVIRNSDRRVDIYIGLNCKVETRLEYNHGVESPGHREAVRGKNRSANPHKVRNTK